MPTTISESPSVVTLIDVFEATPHEQADLVEPHSTAYSATETLPPHSLTVLIWTKP